MTLVFIIFYTLSLGLLLVVSSMRTQTRELSKFELARRANAGDGSARDVLRRESYGKDVLTLQRVALGLLYITTTLLAIAAFHWVIGIIVSIMVTILLGAITRLAPVRRYGKVAYEKMELAAKWLDERYPKLLELIRYDLPTDKDKKLGSREELEHLVAHAADVLSPNQKQAVAATLAFHDRTVKDVMTSRTEVDTITSSELLGPLVLDDLHKTGHSLIPVTTGEDNHIVGILHLKDLVTLDKKRSLTAGKAMEPQLFYIREDQLLESALATLLKEQQQLLIVVNKDAEVAGIISLKDVIAALRGRTDDRASESYDNPRSAAVGEHSKTHTS